MRNVLALSKWGQIKTGGNYKDIIKWTLLLETIKCILESWHLLWGWNCKSTCQWVLMNIKHGYEVSFKTQILREVVQTISDFKCLCKIVYLNH